MMNEYRNDFANSLPGTLSYIARQVFKTAQKIEIERGINLIDFDKKLFICLLNEGKWTSKDEFYRVRYILREYAKFLETQSGISFQLDTLNSIQKKDLDQSRKTDRYFRSFKEMEDTFRQPLRRTETEWRDKSILLLYAVGLKHEEVASMKFENIDIHERTITTHGHVYHEIEPFVLNHLIINTGHINSSGQMFSSVDSRLSPFMASTAKRIAIAVAQDFQSKRSMKPKDLRTSYALNKLYEYEKDHSVDENVLEHRFEWLGIEMTPRTRNIFLETYRDWKINV